MAGPLARLYATLGLDAREFDTGLGRAQKSISGFGRATDLAIAGVSGAIAGGLLSTIGAAREWETAFAGVKKTVDTTGMTAEQEAATFGKLEGELRKLATTIPITATELAGLAEAGGALGVAADDLAEFARVTAIIGTTTDVVAQDAATALGKIGTVMRLTADDYDNFGAALVDLGNKGASFESEILETANRIAGTSSVVGLAKDQMLGWASALANVGIMPEAAGGSFQKFAYGIQGAVLNGGKQLEMLADLAGVTQQAFVDLYNEDVSAAFESVLVGYSELDAAAQQNARTIMKWGGEIRIKDFIAKLTGDVTKLSSALDVADSAWEENTAMMVEAERRFETLDSGMQLFWNKVNDVAITLGRTFIPMMRTSVEHVGNLVSLVGQAAAAFPEVTSAVTMLVTALSGLTALRFGARFLGLGPGFDSLLSSGLGKAWAAAGVASKAAISAAGAAAGVVYGTAASAVQRLLGPLQAAWTAAMGVGSRVMVAAEAAGMATGTRFAVGLAKGVTLVGIASILAKQFEDTFGGESSFEVVESIKDRLATDLAARRPEMRAELEAAGFDIGGGLAEGIEKGANAASALAMTGAFSGAFNQWRDTIKGQFASPIREEMDDAVEAVKVGFGSIKAALAKPPKFISNADREANMEKRIGLIRQNINKARKAGDDKSRQYWERGLAAQETRLERFRRSHGQDWEDIETKTERKSRGAANVAIDEAERMKRTISGLDMVPVGVSLISELANGVRSAIPNLRAAIADVIGVVTLSQPRLGPPAPMGFRLASAGGGITLNQTIHPPSVSSRDVANKTTKQRLRAGGGRD